jgi:hypothetical protein
MRRASKFKKCEITRAAKAVQAAGLEIARVEVSQDGSIIVVPSRPAEETKDNEKPEDLVENRGALLAESI